jgi:hypothetical protein
MTYLSRRSMPPSRVVATPRVRFDSALGPSAPGRPAPHPLLTTRRPTLNNSGRSADTTTGPTGADPPCTHQHLTHRAEHHNGHSHHRDAHSIQATKIVRTKMSAARRNAGLSCDRGPQRTAGPLGDAAGAHRITHARQQRRSNQHPKKCHPDPALSVKPAWFTAGHMAKARQQERYPL